jgi:ABC-type nitrate/sulfonate/bicarbonate transport system permease component
MSYQADLWIATIGTLKSVFIGYPLGTLSGAVCATLLGFTAVGRHISRAVGFAILATPLLLASYLLQSILGPTDMLPSVMAFLPSFALSLHISSNAAWKATATTPVLARLSTFRRLPLLWTVHGPHILSGIIASALISFPVALLYTTIGDTASSSSEPSLGRIIVGSLPSGDVKGLTGIAATIFGIGIMIWLLLSLASRLADRVFGVEHLESEQLSDFPDSERKSLALAPFTGIGLVAAFFAIGSVTFPEHLLIRSPITSLATLGSDYVELGDIAIRVTSTIASAIGAAIVSTMLGYLISTSLPVLLKPFQVGLVMSAIFVQIVPITVIASLLWLLAPALDQRDWLVAVLSGLYPAYVIMRERQRTLPVEILDLVRLRGTGAVRKHYYLFVPWAAYALPACLLATVPFTVNALVVCGAVLRGEGTLGQLIYSVNARGEATMIQGLSLLIISIVLLTTGLLTYLQQWSNRRSSFSETAWVELRLPSEGGRR